MACIKYFEIIHDIVDPNIDYIARTSEISRLDICKKIREYCEIMRVAWYSNQNPNIPYHDPLCRLAYLYSTVPVNANLVEFVFENDNDIENYLDSCQSKKGSVSICVFGGGPGTEILGLAKRIEKRRLDDQISLRYVLLDKVTEWQESLIEIESQIETRLRNKIGKRKDWPLTLTGHSTALDITDTANFGNFGNIFGKIDVFILSYVVSEVFDDAIKLQSFLSKMTESAPSGAKFIFIERNEPRWVEKINIMSDVAKLTLSSEPNHTSNYMSLDEQRTHLGKLLEDVGRSPRTNWNAFWVVGTKE
jgi:hypothetical protein